jgi:hypothetical protein
MEKSHLERENGFGNIAVQHSFNLFLGKFNEALEAWLDTVKHLVARNFLFSLTELFLNGLLQFLSDFCGFRFGPLLTIVIGPTSKVDFIERTASF